MRVVKIMDACDWSFEEPACLHIVWHGSAGPHPASYQERQTKITISKLWFVDPQRFAGSFQEK